MSERRPRPPAGSRSGTGDIESGAGRAGHAGSRGGCGDGRGAAVGDRGDYSGQRCEGGWWSWPGGLGDGGGCWDGYGGRSVEVTGGDRTWGQLMARVVPGTAGGGGGVGGGRDGGTERWLSSTERVSTVSRRGVTGDRPSPTL